MVARAFNPNLDRLLALGPIATGTMHRLIAECVGQTLPTDEELCEALVKGTQKEIMAKIGMPRLAEFTKSNPPTVAEIRQYLAACCRKWVALLEDNSSG